MSFASNQRLRSSSDSLLSFREIPEIIHLLLKYTHAKAERYSGKPTANEEHGPKVFVKTSLESRLFFPRLFIDFPFFALVTMTSVCFSLDQPHKFFCRVLFPLLPI